MNTKEVNDYIRKAKKYYKTASHLIDFGDFESSASRSYYSMYYMAKAVLLTEGAISKTHVGLITIFSRIFIKTKILPKESVKYLKKGFEIRLLSDYNVTESINKETSKNLLDDVDQFNSLICNYLKEKKLINQDLDGI